jgi:hypothetical protein
MAEHDVFAPQANTPETGIPRLAFSKAEAAKALGVSDDFVADHIWPEVKLIRRGRKTFVSRRELEAWLERSASRTLAS